MKTKIEITDLGFNTEKIWIYKGKKYKRNNEKKILEEVKD